LVQDFLPKHFNYLQAGLVAFPDNFQTLQENGTKIFTVFPIPKTFLSNDFNGLQVWHGGCYTGARAVRPGQP